MVFLLFRSVGLCAHQFVTDLKMILDGNAHTTLIRTCGNGPTRALRNGYQVTHVACLLRGNSYSPVLGLARSFGDAKFGLSCLSVLWLDGGWSCLRIGFLSACLFQSAIKRSSAMIALRGRLREADNKKWKWTGVWTFGVLPDDVDLDAKSPKSKNATVRPFSYTWESSRKASEVLVPSLNRAEPDHEEEEDEEEEENSEKKDVVDEMTLDKVEDETKNAAIAQSNDQPKGGQKSKMESDAAPVSVPSKDKPDSETGNQQPSASNVRGSGQKSETNDVKTQIPTETAVKPTSAETGTAQDQAKSGANKSQEKEEVKQVDGEEQTVASKDKTFSTSTPAATNAEKQQTAKDERGDSETKHAAPEEKTVVAPRPEGDAETAGSVNEKAASSQDDDRHLQSPSAGRPGSQRPTTTDESSTTELVKETTSVAKEGDASQAKSAPSESMNAEQSEAGQPEPMELDETEASESRKQSAPQNQVNPEPMNVDLAEETAGVEKEDATEGKQETVEPKREDLAGTKDKATFSEKENDKDQKRTSTSDVQPVTELTSDATKVSSKAADSTKLGEAARAEEQSRGQGEKEPELEKEKETETEPIKGITFATTSEGEPSYTQASTLHEGKCPPDGNWNGYFENVAKRKDRYSNRIPEEFTLFLNGTPAKDARTVFLDEADQAEAKKDDEKEEGESAQGKPNEPKQPAAKKQVGLLPSGHIHVRGMGTNQFGTFELLGSLNLENGILECQRMYIVTSEPSRASPRRPAVVTRGVRRGADGAGRPYSTRKRQLSWQRRSSLSDDEDEIVGMRRNLGSSKKRPRSNSNDPKIFPAGPAVGPSGFRLPIQLASGVPGTKYPLPRAGLAGPIQGTKKRGHPTGRTSSSSSSPVLKLPLAGDPNEASWRAAHFLYYRRNDDNDESGNSSSGAASFVIYEGEFLHGRCQREGRGVCLYNNRTLYEGEWKRNREHGNGTLMTANRRTIIYKGEWERGRMHGKGTYYYSQDKTVFVKSGVEPSRYEGEFKENARYGMGKYYLPNGSTYEGEWRDNMMSGRGTFVWPDGSTYVGLWKDGKRNGQGLLRASDGFTYDGMWVRNAMEGRGIATYPNGQTYEGLWACGRREGRGTIRFKNGAVYEGRFRDDCIEGQGTMKMTDNARVEDSTKDDKDEKGGDWMIPISFQSDMGHIHQKAGFTVGGE